MKLNDQKMLPKQVLRMENMKDVLQSEDSEMERIHDLVDHQERQLTISTATTLLGRHERILGLTTDSGSTLEDRRSRIIAKLLGQGTVTARLIQHVAASFTNGEVEVIEHPSESSFDVQFIGVLGTPPNMPNLTSALDEIKPAYLTYRYLYRYLLVEDVEQMTLEELEAKTIDQFAFGGDAG